MIAFAYLVCASVVGGTVSASGLHGASSKGFFQVSPSFSGDGVTLYPGQHPDHDHDDLSHLIADHYKELHYTQEGHRAALHGAKHANFQAKFTHPTVVLEHSNHVSKVKCHNNEMTICFKTPGAMKTAQGSWSTLDSGRFQLVTYHVGCGDKSGKKRSFFNASNPVFDTKSSCVSMPVSRVTEKEALNSADLKWGTYVSPTEKRRQPVQGHVRLAPLTTLKSSGPPENATVDLTTDADSLKTFFDTTHVDTSKPDHLMHNIPTIGQDGEVDRRGLDKRSLWSWIEQAILAVAQAILDAWVEFVRVLEQTANYIVEWGEVAISYLALPFTHPFGFSYHEDLSFRYPLKTKPGVEPPPAILGLRNGFSMARADGAADIECVQCLITGSFNIDGELSFSLLEGITKGEIGLHGELSIRAIFGVSVHGKIPYDYWTLKKPLASLPLKTLSIPGIFSLGPQVTINTAIGLEVSARGDMLVGGTFTLSSGGARLSLISDERTGFTGFTPSFSPVLVVENAEVKVTADFGLPVALEVGLDVLEGAFKTTVGLVDAPSVYVTTEVSINSECKGVEMRLGAKNRIYLAALGVYEYTLHEHILYETNAVCVSRKGFNKDSVATDGKVFEEVEDTFGGKENLPTNDPPTINQVDVPLSSELGKEGFRILMDANETSIVVSGADGFLYLADKSEEYDLTAPLGTLDTEQNMFSFDVLGRLLHYNEDEASSSGYRVMPLRVTGPKEIARSARCVVLSELKTDHENFETYGMSIPNTNKSGPRDLNFFPTACQIEDHGLRLFATRALVLRDGNAYRLNEAGASKQDTERTRGDLHSFGADITKCRTVRLTSSIKGEVAE